MALPKILDMNRYEEVYDWTLDGYAAVILKTSEKNMIDLSFPRYWKELKCTNKIRGTYNYFRPVFDLYTQLDIYARQAKNTQLPPVADIELYTAYSDDVAFYTSSSQAKIRSVIKEYLVMMADMFGREPIIYTSANFWNTYVGNVDWAKNYLLWVANFHAAMPLLPVGWTEWKIWQYSDDGIVPGVRGEVDLNVFNGTLEELMLLGNVDPTIPPPPPPPAPRQTITILVDNLRIRVAPSITATAVGNLPKGIKVDFVDTYKAGNDIWYQIGYKQWCAGMYNGFKYSEVTCT